MAPPAALRTSKTGTGFACVGALRRTNARQAVRDSSIAFALLTALRMTNWAIGY